MWQYGPSGEFSSVEYDEINGIWYYRRPDGTYEAETNDEKLNREANGEGGPGATPSIGADGGVTPASGPYVDPYAGNPWAMGTTMFTSPGFAPLGGQGGPGVYQNPIIGRYQPQGSYSSPGWNYDPRMSQPAPLQTSDFLGKSRYWADNADASGIAGTITRDRNEIRGFTPEGGWTVRRNVQGQPGYDPDYNPDTGELLNNPRWSGGRRFEGNVQGTPFAAVADKFLRGDTPTGLTGEPITQQDVDLLNQAIAAGYVRPIADVRTGAPLGGPGGGSGGMGGVGGAAGTGGGAGGVGGATGGGAGSGLVNFQGQLLNAQAARELAQAEYQKWLITSGDERLAFEKAQEAFKQEMQRASFEESKRQFDVGQANEMQRARDTTATNLIGIGAQLRGPANYFQYLRTLSGTPAGLRDLVGAAAGRYNLPGYGEYNPVAGTAPQSTGTVAKDFGAADQVYGNAMQEAAGLPERGNMLDPYNMSRMNPTQKALLYGAYEAQGKNPQDVEYEFMQSLPRYRMQTTRGRVSANPVAY